MEEKQETTPPRWAMGIQVTPETRSQYDDLVNALRVHVPGIRSSVAFALVIRVAHRYVLPIINSPGFDPFGVREETSSPQKPKQ